MKRIKPTIGQIFTWEYGQSVKVIDWNTTEGMDGWPKDYVLMHFLGNNQLRVVSQKTFFKKGVPILGKNI